MLGLGLPFVALTAILILRPTQNPTAIITHPTQVDKFDKDRNYIRKWIPEFDTDAYPEKMVDHKKARERCLEVYKEALNG